MSERIDDVETAVDLIGKEKTIVELQTNSHLKIGKILPEENIDLLFAVSDAGVRIPLRKLMLCPNTLKVCKLERCIAYDVDHCSIFQNHKSPYRDRKSTNEEKSKEDNLLDEFVDVLHKKEEKNLRIPLSPPTLPSPYSKEVLTDGY